MNHLIRLCRKSYPFLPPFAEPTNLNVMRIPLLLVITLLLTACGGKKDSSADPSDNTESGASPQPLVVTDSLKALYKEIYSQKKDWLPAKSIFEMGKINPGDEALSDTAFFVFREKLLQAIDRKDAFYLLDKMAADIKCSFGGEDGVAGFVQLWQLDSQEGIASSEVWATLKSVLTQGGIFQNNGSAFVAPYYYALFPDEYDAFTHGVILGRGVRMRESPNLQSAVVKSLSFDVVEILETTNDFETIGGEEYPWVQVKLNDGKEGYIWGKFLGSPIGFRAGFTRQKNGSWLMDFFVSGD